jgi:hypothetical protein
VELGASISVGVDDRCVRSIASDVFQARLHAAETFQVRQPSFLLWQHANQRRDGGCATIVEIALNAAITDLGHTEAAVRKRVSSRTAQYR